MSEIGSKQSASIKDAPVEPVVLKAAFLIQRGRAGFGMLVVTIDEEGIQSQKSFANVDYYTFSFLDENLRRLDFVLIDSQREGNRCLYFFEPAGNEIMASSPADAMLFDSQSLMMGRRLRGDIMAIAFPPEMVNNPQARSDTSHVVVVLQRPKLSCFNMRTEG